MLWIGFFIFNRIVDIVKIQIYNVLRNASSPYIFISVSGSLTRAVFVMFLFVSWCSYIYARRRDSSFFQSCIYPSVKIYLSINKNVPSSTKRLKNSKTLKSGYVGLICL